MWCPVRAHADACADVCGAHTWWTTEGAWPGTLAGRPTWPRVPNARASLGSGQLRLKPAPHPVSTRLVDTCPKRPFPALLLKHGAHSPARPAVQRPPRSPSSEKSPRTSPSSERVGNRRWSLRGTPRLTAWPASSVWLELLPKVPVGLNISYVIHVYTHGPCVLTWSEYTYVASVHRHGLCRHVVSLHMCDVWTQMVCGYMHGTCMLM